MLTVQQVQLWAQEALVWAFHNFVENPNNVTHLQMNDWQLVYRLVRTLQLPVEEERQFLLNLAGIRREAWPPFILSTLTSMTLEQWRALPVYRDE
jgi:hypothetical protein